MITEKVMDARIEGKVFGIQISKTLSRYAAAQEERAAMINALTTRLEDFMDEEGVYRQTEQSIDTIICEMEKIMDVLAIVTDNADYS